jgi:uncharacterized Zn ribbon protein
MSMFRKGDSVVQIVDAPIAGVVTGFDVDQETGVRQIRVVYGDKEGAIHERHFREDEIELATPKADSAAG